MRLTSSEHAVSYAGVMPPGMKFMFPKFRKIIVRTIISDWKGLGALILKWKNCNISYCSTRQEPCV